MEKVHKIRSLNSVNDLHRILERRGEGKTFGEEETNAPGKGMDREVKGGKRTDPLPSVPLREHKEGEIYEYPLEVLTARSLVSVFHTLPTAPRFLQRCAFARQEGEEE